MHRINGWSLMICALRRTDFSHRTTALSGLSDKHKTEFFPLRVSKKKKERKLRKNRKSTQNINCWYICIYKNEICENLCYLRNLRSKKHLLDTLLPVQVKYSHICPLSKKFLCSSFSPSYRFTYSVHHSPALFVFPCIFKDL